MAGWGPPQSRAAGTRYNGPDRPIYWRGSVDDLATDLCSILSSDEQTHLGYRLWPTEKRLNDPAPLPIPMLIWCPACNIRHIDAGVWATRAHHTHACQHCGHVWRTAIVATVGVLFLPGFKDEEKGVE
jgi:hypothetical protein